jgi:tRNA modification GTPase
MFIDGSLDLSNDAIISNARQYAALIRAREDLDSALKSLKSGFTQDIAGLDVEHAMSNISEIDGLSVSEDIVDDIFHRFCVGK